MHTGIIKNIVHPRGFGFIEMADGSPDVFFHFSDLVDLEFSEQLIQRRVEFRIISGGKGPRAAAIRAAD